MDRPMKNECRSLKGDADQEQSERHFEEAISPFMGAMHAQAMRVLRCPDLAHDAVQEALIRAWGYKDLPEDPKGVLLSLVRKSSLHALRCARRRRDHEALARGEVPEGACCAMDPAMELDSREELGKVVSAMGRLTREYRESLELVGRHGLSYKEAAHRLKAPVGTVRSRTSRARAELRRLLETTVTRTSSC